MHKYFIVVFIIFIQAQPFFCGLNRDEIRQCVAETLQCLREDQRLPVHLYDPNFDWSTMLNIPPGAGLLGHQVLHFKQTDKPYQNDSTAVTFVNLCLFNTFQVESDAEALTAALQLVDKNLVESGGVFIELGVCTGKTINYIAKSAELSRIHPLIYGFDSFQGLPEAWIRTDRVFSQGTFALKGGRLPVVLPNVTLIPGFFDTTLVGFVRDNLGNTPIAFLFVDSDLYSSAKTALEAFKNNIVDGTIIEFDEFYHYPGCENHELKAFQEFLKETGFKAEYCVFNINHEQVVVRIRK